MSKWDCRIPETNAQLFSILLLDDGQYLLIMYYMYLEFNLSSHFNPYKYIQSYIDT